MLFNNISSAGEAAAPASSNPLEMLQGCHIRLRHFLQLSRTLADARDVPEAAISDAAASIRRYFSQALPLHEADENETLFPRFQAAFPAGSPLREAARVMIEQHRSIDELMPELLSLCSTIQRGPEHLHSLAGQLRQISAALSKIFSAHLFMEETVIFPALRHFSPEQLEEMSREMQERRRPPEKTIHLVR